MRLAKLILIGAALSFPAVSAMEASGAAKSDDIRHVLLITLDTTRADRLGCYGFTKAATPNLDGLARQGIQFLDAYTHVPLTLPSHCSILTGTVPLYHQVHNNGFYFLDKQVPTLAEVFQRAGYQTAAFVASFTLDSRFGLERGFQIYDDNFKSDEILKNFRSERRAGEVVDAFIPWLNKNSNRGFFAWIHFYDPHLPYDPPSPFKESFPDRKYDGEIAYMDSAIGAVLENLKKAGIFDKTLIVVVGDHGEALGEHKEIEHGLFLYEAAMRVPLLFVCKNKVPTGMAVAAKVGLVDIMPTILKLASLPVPGTVQGISLWPWISGRKDDDLPTYIETYYPRENFGWSEFQGLIDGPWKFIQAPRPELYDLKNDPLEENNLFQKEPSVSQSMVKKLQDIIRVNSRSAPASTSMLSSADQEKLRSLGYLGGDRSGVPNKQTWADPKDKIDDYLLFYRGNLMEGEGRLDIAFDCYREVLGRNPDVPSYYVNLGFLLMKMGRIPEAIELLESARGKFPASVLVLSRLVSFYLRAERWNDAISSGQALLDLQPNDFDALFLSGSAYAKLGKWEEALGHYGKALKIEPENKTLRQRYSYALAAVGRYEEALESYGRLKGEYAGDYSLDLDVGQIYVTTGQIEEAREVYKNGAQLYPCADTFHAYAMFLGKVGDFPEAVRWLKAYLAITQEKDASRKAQAITTLATWEKNIKVPETATL
jgi:arylsulfatase A-like enzyme/tetratricopeptide (TPR) repeat protein